MDEDTIFTPNPAVRQNPEIDEEKDEPVPTGGQVFDITPDLNIAPIREEASPQPAKALDSSELANIGKSVNKIAPETPTENATTINRVEFGPANPPAKTIKTSHHVFPISTDGSTKGVSLKEAVGTAAAGRDESVVKIDKPTTYNYDPRLKPLRTYESDIAEAIARRRLSTSKIIIAEENKKREQAQPPKPEPKKELPKKSEIITKPQPLPTSPVITIEQKKPEPAKIDKLELFKRQTSNFQNLPKAPLVFPQNPEPQEPKPRPERHILRNIALTLLSLVLLLGGAFIGYYLYTESPLAVSMPTKSPQPVTTPQFSEPLIPVNTQVSIVIDGLNSQSIKTKIVNEFSKNQNPDSIKEIIPATYGPTSAKNLTPTLKRVTAGDMVLDMGIRAPDILTRSLGNSWMLGIYADKNNKKSLFIITTNNFFQNAFAGILRWESTMIEDLAPYLVTSLGTNTSSDMSSSPSPTEETSIYDLNGQFVDRIIKNKDVREYVSRSGKIIFLYSFVSNDRLVITDNEEALTEIITRLEKQTFVR